MQKAFLLFWMCHFGLGSTLQPRVIYYEMMTPVWLEAHASYIDSARSQTPDQLTFNAGQVDSAALLKVPLFPAGVLKNGAPLTVRITVSNDINIGKQQDSDISHGLSDGKNFIGFLTVDAGNYGTQGPCYGSQGTSGTISRLTNANALPKITESSYPGQFVFTFKVNERWGSCYTAHDGGHTRQMTYQRQLILSNGLNLELYKMDKTERVGIKYIEVTVYQGSH